MEASVKDLEWVYRDGQSFYTYYVPDFGMSIYWINQQIGSDSFYFTTMKWDGTQLYDGDDLPSAKAAAQQDYEARIMSALSTPPQPVFADRHNDETGECEMVDAEPEMVAALRRRVAERKSSTDEIAALRKRCAELEAEVTSYQGLLDAAIDDYNDAIKPKPEATTAPKPFTFADPAAQREWERQRREEK